MQLKDKAAIVTGAASGIGKEIARRFVGEGARVAIAHRDLDATWSATDEIGASEGSTIAVQVDLTGEEQVIAGVLAASRSAAAADQREGLFTFDVAIHGRLSWTPSIRTWSHGRLSSKPQADEA